MVDDVYVTLFRDRKRRGFPQLSEAPDAGFTDEDYAPGPIDGPKRVRRSVRELLTTTFSTDVYFVAYINAELPLRLNHGVWLHSAATTITVDVYEVDCVERDTIGNASPSWWAEEQDKIARLQAAEPNVIAFRSRGGYRLLGARARPFTIDSEAASITWTRDYVLRAAWLFHRFAIRCDPACRDWTRFQRAPHATRDDGRSEPGIVLGDIERFGAWRYSGMTLAEAEGALAALAAVHENWQSAANAAVRQAATPAKAPPRLAEAPSTWDVEGPAVRAAISHLGSVFPVKNRHHLCQAVGGMLRDHGATMDVANYIVFEAARLGGSTDPRTRAKAATDTWRLGDKDAKTAYTTVCGFIGKAAAERLGDFFNDAKNEALRARLERTRRRPPALTSAAPTSAPTSAAPASAAPASPIDQAAIRKAAIELKRRKAAAEELSQNIHALILEKMLSHNNLTLVEEIDHVQMSATDALAKLSTVLGWNVDAPWEGVAALIELSVWKSFPKQDIAEQMQIAKERFERGRDDAKTARLVRREEQGKKIDEFKMSLYRGW